MDQRMAYCAEPSGALATCATADSQNESAVCGPILSYVTDEDRILGENFSNNVRWRALSAPVVVPANPRSCDEWRSVFHTASYARSFDNNRRDYFQLIDGSSASVKPLACGGNKPHVQWSTEEGVICPRCLRILRAIPPCGPSYWLGLANLFGSSRYIRSGR